MIEKRLKIILTLKAPFLTQSSEIGAFGIDSPLATTFDGKYCITWKLVKGCLRQSWTELSEIMDDPPKIVEWLGNQSAFEEETGESVEPVRSKLNFEDFINDKPKSDKLMTRISINDDLGSVKDGALQVIEAPFVAGEDVSFIGFVEYFTISQTEADEIKKHLEIGLRWICNLGALENVNFGQLTGVDIEDEQIAPRFVSTAQGIDKLNLTIQPGAPFCIAKKRTTNNLFESEEVISGAVLKGAFIETWKKIAGLKSNAIINENSIVSQKELAKNIDKIRFTFAFPAAGRSNERSVKPPLSLVKIKDNNDYFDVAFFENPILIDKTAPAFSIDWKDKDWDKINAEFGSTALNKQIRVQTAIENNRAKFNSLYAYELIVPDNFEWYGRVDLHQIDVEERKIVEQQIRQILSFGLHGIGKTKASAVVETDRDIKPKLESSVEPVVGKWIITLQTPAIICDPQELDETSGRKELFAKYKEAWSSLSHQTLKLSHFYASQSLAGGEYLYQRFQAGKPYNPYLLTDTGSVFVLTLAENKTEKDAQDEINKWHKYGLPLPDWAIESYSRNGTNNGNHWSNCPYIPENGFGEIAVNLPVHLNKKPTNITDLSEHWRMTKKKGENNE